MDSSRLDQYISAANARPALMRSGQPQRDAGSTACVKIGPDTFGGSVTRGDVRRLVIGCGYLGERIARMWCDAGDDVYATTRGGRADALSAAAVRPLILDVTQEPGPLPLPEVDTVVFAVGRDRRSGATMADIHVKGLGAVLDALPSSTGRVIYVSSTGVYAQDAGEWVDEDSVCEPLLEGGMACLSAERLLSAHARGRDAVALRLAGLYGPGRIPLAADVATGRPIANSADAYLNLIHVDDAARAVVAAAAAEPIADRCYTVSDGNPSIRGEYVRLLATRLGVAPPLFTGGGGLGKRVRNARLVGKLGLRLHYPSYREGLAAS
jgi:nucleoside-diphosphate-sugar epimerase